VSAALQHLEELKKHWWWKQNEVLKKVAASVTWDKVKDAARNYELMRRAPEALERCRNTPYSELAGEIQMLVHRLWVRWEQPYRYADTRRDYEESGWSPIYDQQHIQWNLRLPDSLLKKAFVEQLERWRAGQNIPVEPALTGRKNRAASWNYIEFLDRANAGEGKSLNSSQRHMVSEARRKASQYAKEFNQAFEDWQNTPPSQMTTALGRLASDYDGPQTMDNLLAGLVASRQPK